MRSAGYFAHLGHFSFYIYSFTCRMRVCQLIKLPSGLAESQRLWVQILKAWTFCSCPKYNPFSCCITATIAFSLTTQKIWQEYKQFLFVANSLPTVDFTSTLHTPTWVCNTSLQTLVCSVKMPLCFVCVAGITTDSPLTRGGQLQKVSVHFQSRLWRHVVEF